MFSSGFILRTIKTYIIWIKALLDNKLNDFCIDTLCFLLNVSLIEAAEFLSIITASANWGTVFDLKIPR